MVLSNNHDDLNTTIDENADVEIEDMKLRYANRLKAEDETLLNLMSDHQALKKNLQVLGKDAQKHLIKYCEKLFHEVKLFKPKASRKDSPEKYLFIRHLRD